jgi:Putative peptidoglycan binding domain
MKAIGYSIVIGSLALALTAGAAQDNKKKPERARPQHRTANVHAARPASAGAMTGARHSTAVNRERMPRSSSAFNRAARPASSRPATVRERNLARNERMRERNFQRKQEFRARRDVAVKTPASRLASTTPATARERNLAVNRDRNIAVNRTRNFEADRERNIAMNGKRNADVNRNRNTNELRARNSVAINRERNVAIDRTRNAELNRFRNANEFRGRNNVAINRNRTFAVNRTSNAAYYRGGNVRITNNWRGDAFRGHRYAAFRNYHRQWHDRGWWRSHYNRIVFVSGGWYYWNAGYWFPAWGYAPSVTYVYDGPIYAYNGLPPDQVTVNVQEQLARAGYYDGPIDGILGPMTREAIAAYQADNGLAITSAIDEPTLDSLGLA